MVIFQPLGKVNGLTSLLIGEVNGLISLRFWDIWKIILGICNQHELYCESNKVIKYEKRIPWTVRVPLEIILGICNQHKLYCESDKIWEKEYHGLWRLKVIKYEKRIPWTVKTVESCWKYFIIESELCWVARMTIFYNREWAMLSGKNILV